MARTNDIPGPAKIKVIGCGGAGCNAVTKMVQANIRGVEFIAVNTDAQALAMSEAPTRVQIGEKTTRGLGAGSDWKIGHEAALESSEEIREVIGDANLVFIIAGLGGGTGTGSAPVVGDIAKNIGALTIGIVSTPFDFEGKQRSTTAIEGFDALIGKVDTLIIIRNQALLPTFDDKAGLDTVFKTIDELFVKAIQSITETITAPGLVRDFPYQLRMAA